MNFINTLMASIGRWSIGMKRINYLVMDVDGTLTDGKVYLGNSGEEFKAFNIKDGYGIKNILLSAGIEPIIMTGRTSKIVDDRCKELGIYKVFQGVEDKENELKRRLDSCNAVAYIGDDVNDYECMLYVKKLGGLVGCPCDAVKEIQEISDFVSNYKGGEGAVREFIEWVVYDNRGMSKG